MFQIEDIRSSIFKALVFVIPSITRKSFASENILIIACLRYSSVLEYDGVKKSLNNYSYNLIDI